MENSLNNPGILLQIGGTNVPPSAEKTIEDELFGGCFGVLLFFILMGGAVFFGFTFLLWRLVLS